MSPQDEDNSGFFSRWSRRKAQVNQGEGTTLKVQPEGLAPVAPLSPTPATAAVAALSPASVSAPAPAPAAPTTVGTDAPASAAPAKPTLQDVEQLDAKSDYRSFVAPDVDPEVRNAAFKKLFHTDPHFNVMDGLDIYIDDYSQPDPLPAGMLQRMASAQFMKLVPEPRPESDTVAGHAQDPAEAGGPEVQTEVVAQSPLSSPNAAVSAPHHDHPDLQLQPDLAPADPDPGSRPG